MYRSNLGWAYFRIGTVSLYIVSEIENNEKMNIYSIMNVRKVYRTPWLKGGKAGAKQLFSEQGGTAVAGAELGKGCWEVPAVTAPQTGRDDTRPCRSGRENTVEFWAWAWCGLCFNTTTQVALWRMIVVNQNWMQRHQLGCYLNIREVTTQTLFSVRLLKKHPLPFIILLLERHHM